MVQIQVLLATYNGAAYLPEQLESIFAQIGVDFSVLARDDGSTDGTVDILMSYAERFPGRIQILPSNNRLGAMQSFSALLRAADAPYLAFSDQDDIWYPEKLHTLLAGVKKLEQTYGYDHPCLAHCDLIVIDQNGNCISKSFWKHSSINAKHNKFNNILLYNTVTGCASLFNNALAIFGHDIPDDAIMHDHWLALCASAFGNILPIKKQLIKYRQHNNNALGASSFSIISRIHYNITHGISKHNWKITTAQPRTFYHKFFNTMKDDHKQTVENLIKMPTLNRMQRKLILFRNNFGPSHLLRKLFFWIID